MRCACVDIGSNTTRLLVADVDAGRITPVVERRAFTRLGAACRSGDSLGADALDALAAVVSAQADEARAVGATALRVVATAALRRVANGLEICHALSAAARAPVELLSEHDEARLAFVGAVGALDSVSGGERIVVADVGGGSTELAVGTLAGGVEWSSSLPVGSGDLTAAHLRSDPPTAAELAALRAAIAQALDGLVVPPAARALAVGGSATSLARLAGSRLDSAALARLSAGLVAAPAVTVAADSGVAPERARLLPAAIAVLSALAELLGPLEVARGGLREGIVRELAAG